LRKSACLPCLTLGIKKPITAELLLPPFAAS
jgi:hypothetical protein